MTIQTLPQTNGVYRRKHEPVTFTQVITPLEAAKMLETMKYEHQRAARPRKIQDYAAEMVNGTFRELTQIFIAIYHGQHVILDGQHRLHAVVLSGKPHLFTIVEKEVESEQELAQIYSKTDQGIRRTAGDIYGAHALGEEFGLGKTMLDAFGATIKFMISGCASNNFNTVRAEAIIPHMRLYAPYIQEYQSIIQKSDVNASMYAQLKRTSTMAVVLLSLRFSAPKAQTAGRPSVHAFWIDTLRDDGLRRGDPRKAANQHLLFTRTTASRATDQRNIVSQAYSVRYLGNCLNAYIRGESLQYAKVPNEKAPLNIYGVPSDLAQWW